jgi:hypothetical protein
MLTFKLPPISHPAPLLWGGGSYGYRIGSCTVISFVPSGNVPST